jgi:hypothetical protein
MASRPSVTPRAVARRIRQLTRLQYQLRIELNTYLCDFGDGREHKVKIEDLVTPAAIMGGPPERPRPQSESWSARFH